MKDPRKNNINWKRIGRNFLAYGGGLTIGFILMKYLWWDQRTDLESMWPKGMVKSKIGRSTIESNEINTCYLTCLGTNDSTLRTLLSKGDVHFPPVRREPFPVYRISTSSPSGEKLRLYVESKDSTYNIFKIEDLPGTSKNHICDCKTVEF
jgi:hypothetical protein